MIPHSEIAKNKAEFLALCSKIKRPGIEGLLNWLENGTDFFTAPSSSRFHGAHPGGLCQHSLNVYRRMHRLWDIVPEMADTEEPILITALFHDLCKVNYYKLGTRNVKNEETGKWEKVPCYTIDDRYPMGHGEKSVWILSQYIELTDDEALAIRWHMGGFDVAVKGGEFACSKAYDRSPLALCLHLADMMAAHIDEVEE